MHLKRLDMVGFKSFANRTELEFVPGVTAVVGPNGSGKSNVTDGIRWVLGEQSAKSLRGASMQDVIFSGSDSRKPVGYCEVSITFDNQDQKLHLDYGEVTVTRRVYRSGESEYYINKQACRLKDITELFMDTGIGKEAYSMIGQGRIDEILSTKSEDRRAIFEEAAGIVKYKSRKKEAEKKLDATEQNLARIEDLVSELEDQVAPLAEQAKVAKQYKALKEELTHTEIGLYVHRIEHLHQQWEEAQGALQQLREEQSRFAAEVSGREAELEKLRWEIQQKEQEVETLQGALLRVSEELEKAEGQREVLQERARNRSATIVQMRERLEELEAEESRLKQEQSRGQERLAQKERELKQVQAKLSDAEARLSIDGHEGVQDLNRLKEELSRLLHERTRLASEGDHIVERLARNREQRERLLTQERLDGQAEADLASRQAKWRKEVEEVESALAACADQYKEWSGKRQVLETERTTAAGRLRQAEQQVDTLRSRRDIVKDMEAEHAGFFQGVKEVLKARDRGQPELAGIHGAVAQLIQVPESFEAAVETALGGAMQHLVVENEQVGRHGIRFLKERRAGRATFLPLDVIRGRSIPARDRERVEGTPGFVGVAAELVYSEDRYQAVRENLLGQVLVASGMEEANRIALLMGYRYRIVTLDGDVVNPGGSMSGGSRQKSKNNLLGRSRQVEALEREIEEAQRERDQIQKCHGELREEGAAIDERLDRLRKEGEGLRLRQQELKGAEREWVVEHRNLTQQREKTRDDLAKLDEEEQTLARQTEERDRRLQALSEEESLLRRRIHASQERVEQQASEKDETNREITDWKIRLARLQQEREYLAVDCTRLQQERERIGEQMTESREKLRELEAGATDHGEESRRLAAHAEKLREEKNAAQDALARAKEERDHLHHRRGEGEQALKERQKGLRQQEEALHKQEVRVNRMDVELNHLLEKLAEEYEISFELAKERYPRPEDPKKAERDVRSLKGRIGALGEVNLGAIDEHQRLSTRLSFLSGQRDDLLEAKETLFGVIRDIEEEMSNRFSTAFEAIRIEFHDVFVKMFGGGRADLSLTEPDNLLETGIEITAQPPGKKPQNLGLLSGGERALAAIALLFAVLRYKPVPFCVLDEVDAALDEANLSRFTRYLREFSQKTQFILITHRKRTMEGADVMYGVTMEEAGVSKVVSVKLEEFEGAEEAAVARQEEDRE
ncbi:chromosome segregation protein SMC [Desmospora profundinema]|uniref:Chromosome partition protein Smc n=1 Tax=Desmospora profundinema TaxID=1571184 RepID=A0ABU1IR55_9BACL|nr:chromosome segregation protein SMC [Desmospora profundinema]MDR6227282.1 chromosome segregation protein [Desmospora profundinema]